MSNKVAKGKTLLREFHKVASQVFTTGDFVDFDESGYIDLVDSSTFAPLGMIMESVGASDADYASTTLVQVRIPREPTTEFEIDCLADLAVTDVGKELDFSKTTAGVTINANGSSHDAVRCVGYISTSRGRFVLQGPFSTDGT